MNNNTMKNNKQIEYIELILTRQRNPLPKGVKGHWHHVIPTCCGGPNEAWNKVKLTPEEHFKAHCLLPYIFMDEKYQDKLVCGWNVLSGNFKHLRPFVPEWEELKAMAIAATVRKRKGARDSEETRLKRVTSHLGKPHPCKDETKLKISKTLTGRKQSQEWIAKRTSKQRKPVIAAKDGVELEFASIKEVAKSIGTTPSYISMCLADNKSAKGYTFRYKEAM